MSSNLTVKVEAQQKEVPALEKYKKRSSHCHCELSDSGFLFVDVCFSFQMFTVSI